MPSSEGKQQAKILTELAACRRVIEAGKAATVKRTTLFERGRELGMTNKALGEAAGVSDAAVVQAIKRNT